MHTTFVEVFKPLFKGFIEAVKPLFEVVKPLFEVVK